MLMTHTVHELESWSERLGKGLRAVALHWQPAATFRAVKGEGRDDGVSGVGKRGVELLDIGSAVRLVGEEVEGCAIMPDVVSPSGLPGRHIGDDPLNAIGFAAHRHLRSGNRLGRQVEDSDLPEPQPQSMGGKARGPATHVDQ